MNIRTILQWICKFLCPSSDKPLIDARTNVSNSNISQGKNSPVVTISNNVSTDKETLSAKINELQATIEKLKSESENKYALLQEKYDQMRALEPVPGKCYLRHKTTNRMVCPNCYSKRNGVLHFLKETSYNNNSGMECQVCNKFYED